MGRCIANCINIMALRRTLEPYILMIQMSMRDLGVEVGVAHAKAPWNLLYQQGHEPLDNDARIEAHYEILQPRGEYKKVLIQMMTRFNAEKYLKTKAPEALDNYSMGSLAVDAHSPRMAPEPVGGAAPVRGRNILGEIARSVHPGALSSGILAEAAGQGLPGYELDLESQVSLTNYMRVNQEKVRARGVTRSGQEDDGFSGRSGEMMAGHSTTLMRIETGANHADADWELLIGGAFGKPEVKRDATVVMAIPFILHEEWDFLSQINGAALAADNPLRRSAVKIPYMADFSLVTCKDLMVGGSSEVLSKLMSNLQASKLALSYVLPSVGMAARKWNSVGPMRMKRNAMPLTRDQVKKTKAPPKKAQEKNE
jgi:hypothetical protein